MEKIKVVFRVDREGNIFALFPELSADIGERYCVSYQQVGQHGGADYSHCIHTSRPAKPEESALLREELETIGYSLDERKRHTRSR